VLREQTTLALPAWALHRAEIAGDLVPVVIELFEAKPMGDAFAVEATTNQRSALL
jgi:sorbitol-specific phosphotransferase system component IIBC